MSQPLSPIAWNVILSALVVFLICTCYEARLFAQWRWRNLRHRRAQARQQAQTEAGTAAADAVQDTSRALPLPADMLQLLPVFLYSQQKAEAEAAAAAAAAADVEAGSVEAEEDCAICQEEAEDGEIMCQLPCKHVYHRQCIHAWLARRATCPTCRLEVAEALTPELHTSASMAGMHEDGRPEVTTTVAASSVIGEMDITSYMQRQSVSTDHTVGSSLPTAQSEHHHSTAAAASTSSQPLHTTSYPPNHSSTSGDGSVSNNSHVGGNSTSHGAGGGHISPVGSGNNGNAEGGNDVIEKAEGASSSCEVQCTNAATQRPHGVTQVEMSAGAQQTLSHETVGVDCVAESTIDIGAGDTGVEQGVELSNVRH